MVLDFTGFREGEGIGFIASRNMCYVNQNRCDQAVLKIMADFFFVMLFGVFHQFSGDK